MEQLARHGSGYGRLGDSDSDDEDGTHESARASSQHDEARKPMATFSSDNATLYDPTQQARKILWRQMLRWLTTAVFLIASLATLRIYQGMGNVNRGQKTTFNSLITGLLLLLGLNFFVRLTDPGS